MKRTTFVLSVCLLLFFSIMNFCVSCNSQEKDIRRPAVAGQFYPASATDLRKQIQQFFQAAKLVSVPGRIVGMISPHAGYIYSGWVAAHGYRELEGEKYETVIIIAPSHFETFSEISVYPRGGYETPLGVVFVDEEMAEKIAAQSSRIILSNKGHRQEHLIQREHAVEVQIPFLQMVLKDFKIVPIVMGNQSYENSQTLGNAIAKAAKGHNVLIVASSDLSHYHPYQEAVDIDSRLISYVEKFDFSGLAEAISKREVEACGGGPIVATMIAAEKLGAKKVKILNYANSGDTMGDKSRVVGYLSAVFYRQMEKNPKKKEVGIDLGLSKKDQEQLLEIAKKTIVCCVKGEPIPKFEVSSPKLLEKRGAFVTITKYGRLRGCIGSILPMKSLYQTVQEVAESAALHDPRFPPVRPDELEYLKVEISVLTVPQKIQSIDEIEVGKHGLIIRKGYSQGLLLPQVATDYGWDREEFLRATCRKAGLPTDAWKQPDTEIFVFSAEVFGEE